MEIYGDIYFVINLSMDFICLYICLKGMKIGIVFRRLALGSLLGAGFSLLLLCLTIPEFPSFILTIAMGMVMCRVALPSPLKPRAFITVFLFYTAVSFFMAGGLTFIYTFINRIIPPVSSSYTNSLLFPAALLCAVASIIISQVSKSSLTVKRCRIKLTVAQGLYEFDGLTDSGNLLTEPISGLPVVILCRDISKKIDPSEKFSPEELSKKHELCGKIRVVPVSTGGTRHLLTAFYPVRIEIEGCQKSCLAALSSHKDFAGASALVPSCLVF